jgi:hypothetical protein
MLPRYDTYIYLVLLQACRYPGTVVTMANILQLTYELKRSDLSSYSSVAVLVSMYFGVGHSWENDF